MKCSKYSVVVIGSGISGLYAALKINQLLNLDKDILLVTKSKLEDSNSYYAQGGMVAVLNENKNDSVDLHISDTLKAGAGLSEYDTVKFISQNSDAVVKDLLNFGVDFDKNENGDFTLTKEAAHSVNRILHSGGDATGREMELALCNAIKNSNIKIYENTMAVELLVSNNECDGVVVYNDVTKEYELIHCTNLILATGGVGQLYKYTTNPIGATGDGIALAYKAGATLRDMEFVQFHPTAFAIDDKENNNRFLISEAVRGEGAKLCDDNGIEFMGKYDERRELAPRDIVARSIFSQMKETKKNCVYLNATVIGDTKLLKRFPTIASKCAKYGIDITKNYIPVAPAAHYFMGGIKTNLNAETSIKNLYAIGEVSSTGLHGGNRLASNSLLECVVCAYEVAKYLKEKNITKNYTEYKNYDNVISKYNVTHITNKNTAELKNKLKDIMWENVGIYRDNQTLNNALREIHLLEKEFCYNDKCNSKEEYELRNMIITAKLIVISAQHRKESRGAHYRLDYQQTDTNAKHSLIQINKEIQFC